MKNNIIISFVVLSIIFSSVMLSAEDCNLEVSMINQDPYPAIPGEYVKIIFQVSGISDEKCGQIDVELLEKYPISFDEASDSTITFRSGIYEKDFGAFLTAPFKVRVDENALDGDIPIEIKTKTGFTSGSIIKQFLLNIQDSKVDFEVHVKDYDHNTNTITFEILNIGKNDVEALTVEIPKQENIEIKGPNRNIVGDIDSNEFSTADFEAIMKNGEVKINIIYTDNIDVRRIIKKSVEFDSSYFLDRKADQKTNSNWNYVFGAVAILLIGYYFYRRHKKKKQHHKRRL
tara:strand:+ start:247 stop:1110 length:864 start_codon:yes stop_codon:yes gene_type:complete